MVYEPSKPEHRSEFRERLWRIIFEAETPSGKAFDIALLWAIGLSVVAVMLESIDSVATSWGRQLEIVEWFFTGLFMIEYGLRVWLVRRPSRYIFSFFGIIDLLSWIPTFLEIFVTGSHSLLVIRILRLLRMFRVLKMLEHVRGANVILAGLRTSAPKITVFFFTMLLLSVIMGTIAYLLESESNPKFDNIPSSVYWAVVTITTLGYGDIVPITVAGKFLAAFVVLIGYCIIAVPTGIVIGETLGAVMNRQDETTDACPSCGVHGHLIDAKFCRRCGEQLNGSTDPPVNTGDGGGI
jgi:voltage-gated potassium channel